MNYYISDLHFFHKNVTGEGNGFDGRPYATLEEMHEDMQTRWNRKVTNGDTVYILGDVSLRGRWEELIALVSTLKGHKILIRGNHDDTTDLRYQKLFDEICDYKEITDRLGQETVHLVLSHYPILMWKNQHRGWILLYGHLHNSGEYGYFQRLIEEMNGENFEARIPNGQPIRAYNVGCMLPHMDYEPRTLAEIVRGSYVLIANVQDSFFVYAKGDDRRLKIDYVGGDQEHDIFYMDMEDGTVDHEINDRKCLRDIFQPWYQTMRPKIAEMYETQNMKPLPVTLLKKGEFT